MATRTDSVPVVPGRLPDGDLLDAKLDGLRARFPWARLDRYLSHLPELGARVLVAPGAVIVGEVRLSDDVSIWHGAVLRGDLAPVVIGVRSNVQDGSVLHVGDSSPCTVGNDVVVGHRAVLHGCAVEDGCLVGIQATVLDDAVVGAGSVIGAGAVVPGRMRVPPRSLVLGVPGRVVRELSEEEAAWNAALAGKYARLKENYLRDALAVVRVLPSLLLAVALLPACHPGDDDDSAQDPVDDDDTTPDERDAPPFMTVLESAADIALMAPEGALKYIAPVPSWEREPPITEDCYFQDMVRYPWHLQFLRSLPGLETLDAPTYEAWVVEPDSRIWWGGAVQLWPGATHPLTGLQGVLSFVLYSNSLEPQLTADEVAAIQERMQGCMPFGAGLLAWLPDGGAQRSWAEGAAADLAAAGVGVVFPEDLAVGMDSTTWSAGEGYGNLRVVPEGQDLADYGPRDVVVMTQAPNEMSIVSGLITSAPQNPYSHINMRLREKGIPSATVPGIYGNPLILGMDGQLVHVVAPEDGRVEIEPTTLDEAEQFWEAHQPDMPPIEADLSVTVLAAFADLSHADSVAYGAKAANLSELRNLLPEGNRRDGFAIPFSAYVDHVQRNGIDEEVEDLLDDPQVLSDRAWREERLDDLRDEIRDAPLSPEFEADLEDAVRAIFGDAAETTRLRLRSSTNVEDLDELTGAGLYDSHSGCLGDDLDDDVMGPSRCLSGAEAAFIEAEIARWQAELAADPTQTWIEPLVADLQEDLAMEKPLGLAVKKVWRSLWTTRAFDERAWYGIDHRDAFMGIGVHASFAMEEVEGVLVTNLDPGEAGPRYRLVSQVGELGVVRPVDPTAVAEILTFERAGDVPANVEVLVQSNHADGPLWSPEQIGELASLVFSVQDHFAVSVYPDLDPVRLDLEIERMPGGVPIIKQARPYVSFEPE